MKSRCAKDNYLSAGKFSFKGKKNQKEIAAKSGNLSIVKWSMHYLAGASSFLASALAAGACS